MILSLFFSTFLIAATNQPSKPSSPFRDAVQGMLYVCTIYKPTPNQKEVDCPNAKTAVLAQLSLEGHNPRETLFPKYGDKLFHLLSIYVDGTMARKSLIREVLNKTQEGFVKDGALDASDPAHPQGGRVTQEMTRRNIKDKQNVFGIYGSAFWGQTANEILIFWMSWRTIKSLRTRKAPASVVAPIVDNAGTAEAYIRTSAYQKLLNRLDARKKLNTAREFLTQIRTGQAGQTIVNAAKANRLKLAAVSTVLVGGSMAREWHDRATPLTLPPLEALRIFDTLEAELLLVELEDFKSEFDSRYQVNFERPSSATHKNLVLASKVRGFSQEQRNQFSRDLAVWKNLENRLLDLAEHNKEFFGDKPQSLFFLDEEISNHARDAARYVKTNNPGHSAQLHQAMKNEKRLREIENKYAQKRASHEHDSRNEPGSGKPAKKFSLAHWAPHQERLETLEEKVSGVEREQMGAAFSLMRYRVLAIHSLLPKPQPPRRDR